MGGAAERSSAEREHRHNHTDAADAAAVRAVQAGDAARFGELYLRYYDRVHAYSRLILRDGDEAQDNAQETFMRALQALGRYRYQGVPFHAWLLRIARNCAINRLERRSRSEAAEPHVLAAALPPVADFAATLGGIGDERLAAALEALPLTQRQVLLLRLVVGLTPAETATVVGRSPDAVRQLQRRALSTLRAALGGGSANAPASSTGRRHGRTSPAVVPREGSRDE